MAVEKVKHLPFKSLNKIKDFCKNIDSRITMPSSRSPDSKINRLKQILKFPFRHKFIFGGAAFSLVLIIFIATAIYRGYFMTSANTAQNTDKSTAMNHVDKTIASANSKPTLANPSPSGNPSPSESAVLGDSDNASSDDLNVSISPAPAISPAPTDVPLPTETPSTSDNSSSSSGNANCSTAAGIPNSWYSDIYPISPIAVNNGSVTLTVNIRDCTINNVSSSSTLKISMNSGNTSTQINGQTPPVSITTQNGQASFTVTSQNAGTVDLTIDDTTNSFTVTDTNNNNPSIVFSGSSTSSPTQIPTPTSTQSISPSPTTSTVSPTPTP